MDKEKILLDALNKFGNFTSVEQEFNYNQLEVIYEAMNQVLRIANAVGRSEQLTCECMGLGSTECHKINDKWICSKCNRPLAG